MPTNAELFSVIEIALRKLQEPKNVRAVKRGNTNSIEGIPFIVVDKTVATALKQSKNYAASCKTLAKKYECTFSEQLNGDFMFAKLKRWLAGDHSGNKKSSPKGAKSTRHRSKKTDATSVTRSISSAVGVQSAQSLELRPSVTGPDFWGPERPPKSEWNKIRKIVLERDDHACRFCGHHAAKWMNVHHLGAGSNNDPSNLITVCVACHAVLHVGHNLRLGIIEIWKSEMPQVDIIRRTRIEIQLGKTLAEIKARLPLKRTKLPPDSVEHANALIIDMGGRESASLAKPLCAVFVNFTRWQLE